MTLIYNKLHILLLLLLYLIVVGCTDGVELRLPIEDKALADNQITIKGDFCTEQPNDLALPVRIAFLIDDSTSMFLNDPPDPATTLSQRQQALTTISNQLIAQQGLKWNISEFSDLYSDLTQGTLGSSFVDNGTPLTPAINLLGTNVGVTNINNAIVELTNVIAADIASTPVDERFKLVYQVFILSDFLASNGMAGQQQDEDTQFISDTAQDMKDLENLGIASLSINTGLILGATTISPVAKTTAQGLALNLALVGGGQFEEFEPTAGNPIDFGQFSDLGLKSQVMVLDRIIASNRTILPYQSLTPLYVEDVDNDGLPTSSELDSFNTNAISADTDGDLYPDGLEIAMGLDPNVADADCPDDEQDDDDGDGILECVERLLGTNRLKFDADEDGISDLTEFLGGLNPLQADTLGDLDADGLQNGDELMMHSDMDVTNSNGIDKELYSYNIQDSGLLPDGTHCYSYEITGIALTESAIDANGVAGTNTIQVEIIQSVLNKALSAEVMLKKVFDLQYLNEGGLQAPSNTLIIEETGYDKFIQ